VKDASMGMDGCKDDMIVSRHMVSSTYDAYDEAMKCKNVIHSGAIK